MLGRLRLCVRSACSPSILAGVCDACMCVQVSAFTPPILAGVFGRVCLGARSACTPPLLAGMRGLGTCAWIQVSATTRQSWLGWWGVCVKVRAPPVPRQSWLGFAVCVCRFGFRRHPTIPGRGVGVSVFVCALRLYPATPGWGMWCLCVCVGSGFGRAPPFLAGVLSFVSLCVHSACTSRFLAGVCGVGACCWVGAWAAPRHSWLGCWRLCVCVRTPPVPRQSWLGFVLCALGVAWHLLPCRGSFRVVRASRVFVTWLALLLGTCPCLLVVAGGIPLWRALWPRVLRSASSGLVGSP